MRTGKKTATEPTMQKNKHKLHMKNKTNKQTKNAPCSAMVFKLYFQELSVEGGIVLQVDRLLQ